MGCDSRVSNFTQINSASVPCCRFSSTAVRWFLVPIKTPPPPRLLSFLNILYVDGNSSEEMMELSRWDSHPITISA